MKNKNFDKDSIFAIFMCLICMLIGIIMLYFGITKNIEYNNQIEQKYSITKGIVANVRREKENFVNDKGERVYSYYIAINYTVEDKIYTNEIKWTENRKIPDFNSNLKLKYDKTNPEKVSIYKTVNETIYDFLILLGYMFTIFPLIVLFAQIFEGTKYYKKISHVLIGLSFFGFAYVLLKYLSVNMFEFSFANAINVVGIGIFIPFIFMIIGIFAIITIFTEKNKNINSEYDN